VITKEIFDIYKDKCEADAVAVAADGEPPKTLELYVIDWLLKEYGTMKIVKQKLRVR
jgi:hypothetical protein